MSVRRLIRAVFAGDPIVWRWSAVLGVPLIAVIVVWCAVPRAYYTGTDNVNALTLTAPVAPGVPVCASGLNIPAGTARIQLLLGSGAAPRPALRLVLRAGPSTHVATLPPASAPAAFEHVAFAIPRTAAAPASVRASLCVTAAGVVGWGVTPTLEGVQPPVTVGGAATVDRLAVWYLPPAGSQRSYLAEIGSILDRASLLGASFAPPWLLAIVLFGVLPAIGLLAVRCLAVAAAGRGRRLAVWLFALAALNGAAWSLITPPFQTPDEVDHYAYVQSVAEIGHSPTPYPQSKLLRWSTAETNYLLGSAFFTDHQAADSRTPWLDADVAANRRLPARNGGSRSDGGGYEGAASYGPLYYLALDPGYAIASGGSTPTQLELMRLISALIGALVSVCAYLLVRELAPGRQWLAVLAGLLVAFQPMYSFVAGSVNNDVGIDAGAAAALLLIVRMARRGIAWRTTLPLGLLLGALPFVKGSGYDFYIVTLAAVVGVLWRDRARLREHARELAIGLGVLAVAGAVALATGVLLTRGLRPGPPFPGAALAVATAGSTISTALHAPLSYLTYLWEVFLPRLPGMHPHFPAGSYPASTIFVHTSWGAFGWNDIAFPGWVYKLLGLTIIAGGALGIAAAWRERSFLRRRPIEVLLLALTPLVVIAAVEAVFYTSGRRAVITEFGRYQFPALAAWAALAVAALHGVGRRRMLAAGAVLLSALLAFCLASQLLVLTTFYA